MQSPHSLVDDFTAHYRALLALARRRVSSMDTAADIVHDAFVRVASMSSSNEVRQPRAFFARIIENLVVDRFRQARTGAVLVVDDGSRDGHNDGTAPGAVDTIGPCHFAEASEKAAALDQAVASLPARCREVFLLRKVNGLSHEAIAARLDISRNMVEKHLRRALLTLVAFDDVRTRTGPDADGHVD